MKKTFPILFSLAMICSCFTACGKDENPSSTTESTTMAQNESSGLNSATDASMEDAMNGQNGNNNVVTENGGESSESSNNGGDGLVDDLVSTGEDVVSDAGSAVERAGDAIMGNDSNAR